MLPKAERLTRKDILALSQGKSVFGTLLSVRFRPADKAKYAVSVSKKTASRAVDRNRIRRRVYAALSALKKADTLPKKAFFALIMPKKECGSLPISQIQAELSVLFEKALK